MTIKNYYQIRLANLTDVDSIMNYINEHWRKDHIMSRDKNLFMYEFKENDGINMVLAVNTKTNEIVGIHGFKKSALNSELFDVWGSFWHVRKDVKAPMLGAMLIKTLKKYVPYRNRLEIGINRQTTEKIYKLFFRDHVSLMNHYYILNENVNDFKVAEVSEIKTNKYLDSNDNFFMGGVSSPSDVDFTYINNCIDKVPYKNSEYIINRYFNHPYYKYDIYHLKATSSNALLIGREIEINSRVILRVVDYIGNEELLANSGSFLKELIFKKNYEYIDFYNYGVDKKIFDNAGFINRYDYEDDNIIPNYFEPFISKNIDIYISYKNTDAVFCKGDGDQDRPNI